MVTVLIYIGAYMYVHVGYKSKFVYTRVRECTQN